MFNPNHYTIGIVPSITDQALFCSSLTVELPQIQFSNNPLFLPLSPSFEISERTLDSFVKEMEISIAFFHSIHIDWGLIYIDPNQSEIHVAPSNNQLVHTLAKYIRNTIIDSRFVSAINERHVIPELAISIQLLNQTAERTQAANNFFLDVSWHVEAISFLQFTEFGWQEKFFLPLAEQRKERTKSHAILPCI